MSFTGRVEQNTELQNADIFSSEMTLGESVSSPNACIFAAVAAALAEAVEAVATTFEGFVAADEAAAYAGAVDAQMAAANYDVYAPGGNLP